MAKKKETYLQRRMQKALKRTFKCWVRKIHGNEFQKDIPDLLVCVAGLFVAIEAKRGKGKLSEGQSKEIKLIKKAGGLAFEARSVEYVIEKVTQLLAKNNRLLEGLKDPAEKGSKLHRRKTSDCTPLQAALRKDLHKLRRHGALTTA